MAGERAAPAFTSLRYEVADSIATITLDRPEALNALTVTLKQELLAALRSVARDRAVRAVVLTGAGRAFCAGQDLKERLQPDAAPLAIELRERYNPIIAAMRGLDQPIVGAINGVAAGAGASLAFACDVRLAAEAASFVLAFGRIGLVPDSGSTWFLPRLVGPAKAAELALIGEPLSALDAERFGLVARVVPGDDARGRGAGGRRRGSPVSPRSPSPRPNARSSGAGRPASRRRSRMRPIARASRARRPITPRGSRRSSRNGRLGSAGSSRRRRRARPASGGVTRLSPRRPLTRASMLVGCCLTIVS